MINQKIFLYNDYSNIHKSCFSCHQFSHTIEQCPKLHFVPNKEKIIKKHVFPLKNARQNFLRHRKLSNNSLSYQFSLRTVPKNKVLSLKHIIGMESESDYSDESRSGSGGTEELQENDVLLKIEQRSLKRIVSFKHELSRSLPEEPNNQDESGVLVYSSGMINTGETILNKINNVCMNGCKEKQNNSSSTTTLNEIQVDRVHNFVKYFPKSNIEEILLHRSKILTIEREIYRKYLKKKYVALKSYSFFVNEILEKFLAETNAIKLKSKSTLLITKIIEKETPAKLNENKKGIDNEMLGSPLQKKKFFSLAERRKSQIVCFADLINTLVEKKKSKK